MLLSDLVDVHTMFFWNYLHPVHSKSKDWKAKQFASLGAAKLMDLRVLHVSSDF